MNGKMTTSERGLAWRSRLHSQIANASFNSVATKGAVDGDDDNAFDQTNNVAGVARAMRLDGAAEHSSESRQSSQAVSAKRLRTA